MKICDKCKASNADSATFCENCSAYLGDIGSVECDIADSILEKELRREKIFKIVHILIFVIYYIIFIPLYIIAIGKDRENAMLIVAAVFPGIYYLLAFKAEFLFKLGHIFDIENIDEVEVSDWYIMSSRITGYVILVLGIALMVMASFDFPSGDNVIIIEVDDQVNAIIEGSDLRVINGEGE